MPDTKIPNSANRMKEISCNALFNKGYKPGRSLGKCFGSIVVKGALCNFL